jgi:hypothetical protein
VYTKNILLKMNIFKRIKYYFFPAKYYSIENSTFTNPSLEFNRLNDETILNITDYIQKHLLEVQKLSTKTLKTKKAFEFEKINDLIIFIVKALEFDYKNMEEEKWKFEYFMNYHFLDGETTCIYNKFTNPEANVGYMILTLISIRKYNEKYYCWLNIDDYEPV